MTSAREFQSCRYWAVEGLSRSSTKAGSAGTTDGQELCLSINSIEVCSDGSTNVVGD